MKSRSRCIQSDGRTRPPVFVTAPFAIHTPLMPKNQRSREEQERFAYQSAAFSTAKFVRYVYRAWISSLV